MVVAGPAGVELYRVVENESAARSSTDNGASSFARDRCSQSFAEGGTGRDTGHSTGDITLLMRVADLVGVFACAVAVATTTPGHVHTLATAARSGLVYFTSLTRVRERPAPHARSSWDTASHFAQTAGCDLNTTAKSTATDADETSSEGESGGDDDADAWQVGENVVVELATWRRKDIRVTAIAFANGSDSLAAACTWAGEVIVMRRRRGSSSWRVVCTVDPAADASMHSWLCWTVC